jgi:hypothetical protein
VSNFANDLTLSLKNDMLFFLFEGKRKNVTKNRQLINNEKIAFE